MIELGDQVVDSVSGFKGIVVAITKYLNGCNRVHIQPKVKKDGTLPEGQSFDEPQIKLIKPKKVKRTSKDTGGPVLYSVNKPNVQTR